MVFLISASSVRVGIVEGTETDADVVPVVLDDEEGIIVFFSSFSSTLKDIASLFRYNPES